MFEELIAEKNNIIDNAVYQLILTITGKTEEELTRDPVVICEVTDAIEEVLYNKGIHICRPCHVIPEDSDEERPCYEGTYCKYENCPMRQKRAASTLKTGILKKVCPNCNNDKWEYIPDNGYRCTECQKLFYPDDMYAVLEENHDA